MDDQNKQKNSTRRTKQTTTKQKEEKTVELKESESSPKDGANTLKEAVNFFEEVGYKKVSNKTFINEEDLRAFLNQDFTNINKTKALGFIKILEREYPVDLSELRTLYINYIHDNHNNDHKTLFVHSEEKDENIWKKYLLWVLIPIVGVIAVWYLFLQSGSDDAKSSAVQSKVIVHDINSDVIKKAEQNIVAYDQNKTKEKEIDNDILRVDGSTEQEKNITATDDFDSNVTMDRDDDLDLDSIVKQMIIENNISVENENTVQNNTTKKTDVIEAEMPPLPKKVSTPISKKVHKSVKKQSKSKQHIVSNVSKQISAKKETITKSKLYIEPLKKTWIGIIYLDDFTKKDFLVKSVFKLNSSRPQLIVVGHKFFEIYNNGYSYRFRGNGPIRFIYKDGDIMQINKKEFLTYSKGVNW